MEKQWGITLACVGLLGCAEQAAVPKFPVDADEPMRRDLYEQYRLVGDIGVFSRTWKRRDGEYSWDALRKVAAQYPESADVYQRTNTRSGSLIIPASAGAGIVSGTLVFNLAAPADKREPTSMQVVFYGLGGGLMLASIIASLAWHNPANDFAEVYNRALRRQLGLPESSPAAGTKASWIPRPLGAEGYGWAF